MRRWFSSLLLACLLVAQQGGLLHALGHAMGALGAAGPATVAAGSVATDDTGHSPATDEACAACLAFAALATAATAHAAPPALLAGLGHIQTAPAPLASRSAALPAQRSRGPPALA